MTHDCIEKVIEIQAPVARVWRALADARAFGAWFMVEFEGPFVVGERVRGAMTYPGHEGARWEADIVAMEPEARLVFRWQLTDAKGTWTTVSFVLTPTPTGTRLTLTESGFAGVPEEERVTFLRNNETGWEIQLRNIEAYVTKQ